MTNTARAFGKLALTGLGLFLAGCMGDETISAFADPRAHYRLVSYNDAPAKAEATISFPEKGHVQGRGPCNSYAAAQAAVYPWFELGPVLATRAACPDLEAEMEYFAALGRMTLAEVLGDVVILSNDSGEELVFQRVSE